MRKIITMMLASAIALPTLAAPVAASAQSYREARESQRDVREAKRDLNQAKRSGDKRDVRDARRDVKSAQREARQDWRDYRKSNRNVYKRSAYRGPSGYRYRAPTVGQRFAPAYYGNRYWVRDYARYRLPAPRAGARWIRYGNDILLINIRTGRVLTVYNSFFW